MVCLVGGSPAASGRALELCRLYRQLYEHFSSLIQSGQLGQRRTLPATRELAGSLGLNRTTVSAAYELLESEGFITGHVGRGSFVSGVALADRPRRSIGTSCWSALRSAAARRRRLPWPGGISFATSRPAEQLFPLDALRASCEEVHGAVPISRTSCNSARPADTNRCAAICCDAARAENLAAPDDDLIITNGCQQALDLIGRVLLRPGDKVVRGRSRLPRAEEPLPGSRRATHRRARRAPTASTSMHLQAALERERPRLLVVTSNFQNPTGATLPVAARAALLRAGAKRAACRWSKTISTAICAIAATTCRPSSNPADAGHAILLRSFSKITFPGLRVGWVLGPRALIARLAQSKQLADLHTDQLSQAVLLRFAESGRLAAHRAHMLEAGAERLAAVLAACDRYLPAGSRFTRPQGGMNLWVRLPEPLDAGELLARAQRENVTYLPGKYFAVSRFDPGALRLSFAGLTPEEIRKGLAILGEIFSSELERTRAQTPRSNRAPAMV